MSTRRNYTSTRAGAALALALGFIAPTASYAQPKAPSPSASPKADAQAAPASLSQSLTGVAKAEYEVGKILFQDKDYANALLKFQRTFELSNDPRLLWNIAACEKNLRRYTRMISTLERYSKDKSPLITQQDRDEAAALIATVRALVSTVKLTVNEPGAKVFVDGEEVGVTPLAAPVWVDAGQREIRVSKPGYVDAVRSLQVAGGGEVVVGMALEQEVHRGRLLVKTGSNDIVAVDGRVVGKGGWEGSLKSGGHTLRVSAPGMAIYQSEVAIQDNQTRQVQVTLNPIPKSNVGTWLWIAGGVALTAGAAIGGALLFKPTEAPIQPTTLGATFIPLGGVR